MICLVFQEFEKFSTLKWHLAFPLQKSTGISSLSDGRDNAIGGYSVLVFSDLGISRSVTIALAYLIHRKKISLKVIKFLN